MAELCVLVTGRAVTGKSSLINGILGLKVEEEGAAIENENCIIRETCTTQVKEYRCTKDGVLIKVLDTPGLMDGTHQDDDYLKQIKEKSSSQRIDLMIYCINSSVTRFVDGSDNEEVSIMTMLTQAFGQEIWEKTVIALTFANNIEATQRQWRRLPPDEKMERFNEKISEFAAKIRSLLKREAKIQEKTVEKVKIVPAGYYTEQSLPDREFWLSDLWFHCLDAIQAPEAKTAFYAVNIKRIKDRASLKDGDLHRDIERQPIIVYDHTKKEAIARCAKYGAVGVVAGGVIGAVTSGIGVVPLTVGAVTGAAVAGCVGYFVKWPSSKDTK